MNKSLKARIDLANKWIKFAQRHNIWGEGYFGSTWPVHIEYTHLIDVSPKGNRATVRYDDHAGGLTAGFLESYNLNDEYSVGDLRHEISNYIIKAIKNGAKSDGVPLPKFNPRRRRNPQVDLPGMHVRGRLTPGHPAVLVNPRKLSYREARFEMWQALGDAGWDMSRPNLKVAHATWQNRVRLWLKPQSILVERGGAPWRMGVAHALVYGLDLRQVSDFPAFVRAVERRLGL